MINSKLKLTAIALLCSSSSLFAQQFYVTAGGGYAFPFASQQGFIQNSVEKWDYSGIVSKGTRSVESIPFCLGKGMNFGLSVGYMFNDHIGIDLGFNYLYGSKTTGVQEQYTVGQGGVNSSSQSIYTSTVYSRMYRIMPSLIVTHNLEKFNPYFKLGAVFSLGSLTLDDKSESSNTGSGGPSSYNTESKTVYNGGMGFGLTSALGVSYKLTEKLSVFAEANFISLSYAPRKSEVVKDVRNGVDKLPTMTTRQKETEYKKSFSIDFNQVIDEDKPFINSSFSFPSSSIGINLGVSFSF